VMRPCLSGDMEEAGAARWKRSPRRNSRTSRGSRSRACRGEAQARTADDREGRAIGPARSRMRSRARLDRPHRAGRRIKAPVLILAADGGFQRRIRSQVQSIRTQMIIAAGPGTS
jgi:hypothetical protein